MNKIRDIDSSVIDQNKICLCYTLVLGKENINDSENIQILKGTLMQIWKSANIFLFIWK